MKLKYILPLCIALQLCTSKLWSQNKSDQPNILFIAIDDMNDWTGFLGGHPESITPNLDKLAEEGINFTNAHCSAPGCSPSRNALLYGVEPYNSGLYPFYDEGIHQSLMKKYTSLPRLFKENGYETYGAGKIHHGSKNDPREWTEYENDKPEGKKKFKEGEGYRLGKSNKMSFRPTHHPDKDHKDYIVASYGVDVLNRQHDKPFFLAVGIVKPHLPFDAPKRFFDALPDSILPPAIKANDLKDIPMEGKKIRKAGEANKFHRDQAWSDVRKAYLACISWADFNIGRVLSALENSEYADNTVVVVWSDHGFHLGEKGAFKKFTLWERATRVPFIIYDPRSPQQKGRTYDESVSLINIYKTLADMTGIEVPDYVDGQSLVPVLNNQTTQMTYPTIISWGKGNYAVRSKDYRYIHYFDGSEELYNHLNDKNEWHNVVDKSQYQEIKNELKTYLPKDEAPMIKEYVNPWSVEGENREEYRPVKQK
ncbi:sulfatase [Flammeovirga sp. MY04]|uniref:sulfatase n=1 Tax=Flammeovirga sp. MY04 TaxID=1191459 RepID=UPI00080643AC|nr:sulfatase [Flammeovirga sp. MY04]ANQ52469.1 sulfatase [Flammeovirga sp. MY04]